MIDFEYSKTARVVFAEAKKTAVRLKCEYIDGRHLFSALFTVHRGVAYSVLLKNGLRGEDMTKLGKIIAYQNEQSFPADMKDKRTFGNEVTARLNWALDMAKEDARRLGAEEIGTELLLLAVLRDANPDVLSILKNKQINPTQICVEVLNAMGLGKMEAEKYLKEYFLNQRKAQAENKKSMLETYGRDMTRAAKEGKLDPVVGRHDEIIRVMQILSRRSKNNACLVGEPGVGKTAIVEGIAQLINRKAVPDSLLNKRIMSLDLAAMLAGTRYRGDFEERLKGFLDEVKDDDNVIVFIDELHTLIGAGGTEGTHDAANIIKPALSRGEIHVIGATTMTEYRQHIEKDAALERRFQPVSVEEPTREETIEILDALADHYQNFHKVEITGEAIAAAVDMSIRYINDRFLPDKAIDLMDEACSRVKLGNLTLDETSMVREDKETKLRRELEEALKNDDIKKAAKARKAIAKLAKADKKVDIPVVTADDIADVVSVWTKIPAAKINETEQTRLLKLEDTMHKRVVGQVEAVTAVANAIKRSRSGLRSPNRPIGSFLFLGPTGVGKTELSKALAETLFGDEKSLIRVDMSEYMEKHTVSKMIGSPPGYVGYDEGGQLSEKVRRNPYSVVLFDEIEKAHPDVFNVLLQVLDDGILTDAKGIKVSFKNTIIIMTSNLGADRIIDPKTLGFVTDDSEEKQFEDMKKGVMEEVKKLFRPEFINRLDDIIVFKSLSEAEVLEIAGLMLKELKGRVRANLDIKLNYGAKLKKFIFDKGYDKKYGARPLRRAVQQYVEDPMAEALLNQEIKRGTKVSISVKDDKVVFNTAE